MQALPQGSWRTCASRRRMRPGCTTRLGRGHTHTRTSRHACSGAQAAGMRSVPDQRLATPAPQSSLRMGLTGRHHTHATHNPTPARCRRLISSTAIRTHEAPPFVQRWCSLPLPSRPVTVHPRLQAGSQCDRSAQSRLLCWFRATLDPTCRRLTPANTRHASSSTHHQTAVPAHATALHQLARMCCPYSNTGSPPPPPGPTRTCGQPHTVQVRRGATARQAQQPAPTCAACGQQRALRTDDTDRRRCRVAVREACVGAQTAERSHAPATATACCTHTHTHMLAGMPAPPGPRTRCHHTRQINKSDSTGA
jgi:hypothetical protein